MDSHIAKKPGIQASQEAPYNGSCVTPRIIIHGGAGNITRENLPPDSWKAYRTALLSILRDAHILLTRHKMSAVDVATYAVSRLEDCPLFNAGKEAVLTRAGTFELEASIMVSRGYRKRGVGVMGLKRVKNPIKLAKSMLERGELEDGGGAQGHLQLYGEYIEKFAEEWGCEMVEQDYFWTKKRWKEHKKGLRREKGGTGHEPEEEYMPQGTVGAVVLDQDGILCVATSTGGMTNKLPGRIGDTPTLGAGFWAEEWSEEARQLSMVYKQPRLPIPLDNLMQGDFVRIISDCLPFMTLQEPSSSTDAEEKTSLVRRHAVAMSGTGNGDSFLKTTAVRTAAAISRFSTPNKSLQTSVSAIAGPNGELQKSAGDRWRKTFEGQGGIIGIELVENKGSIVADFNCGGMFRAWIDDEDIERCMVFKEEY